MTTAQKRVIEALQNSDNEWDTWQTCGLTGRTQPAFDALVKKGVLVRRPGCSGYRLK